MGVGDPKRVRWAVRPDGRHIGYVTVTAYPDRDLLLSAAGSPYSEVVVSDLGERHVALFQQFKEHWLIHCGPTYTITAAAGELGAKHVEPLAAFALRHRGDSNPVLAAALKVQLERLLT